MGKKGVKYLQTDGYMRKWAVDKYVGNLSAAYNNFMTKFLMKYFSHFSTAHHYHH